MMRRSRLVTVIAICACLAACAGPGASPTRTSNATPIAPRGAKDGVIAGKSTKADVLAAFGKTTVVSFDSGFEVWVYQITSDTPDTGNAEFVLLFAPSGIVTKTRIRPPSPVGQDKPAQARVRISARALTGTPSTAPRS